MAPEIILIVHNLRSSHNVGSLLRTADGLGVAEMIFTGYTPYPAAQNDKRLPHIASRVDKQIRKTALGAEKIVPWRHTSKLAPLLKKLSASGYLVCALEQAENSKSLPDFSVPPKIALILGNEVDGLRENELKLADSVLEIPMYGKKESFNVAQAAAMALYAFRFSRP